jgi:alpha-tubulin suppressor-like RCC1 family protein
LQENGDVLGWGRAGLLQISGDNQGIQLHPTLIPNIHDIKAMYPRDFHVLFIDKSGEIHELGFLEPGKASVFQGIGQVQQVATRWATSRDKTLLAVKEDGTVWAWGAGQQGQLGIGQLTDTTDFVNVPIDNVKQVAFTFSLALAVRDDGTLWAWGKDYGEIIGSQEIWTSPQQVPDIENVQSVVLGDGLSILHTDGTVSVLIEGDTYPVKNLPPIAQIDGSYSLFTVGAAVDGTVWAWGAGWAEAVFPEPIPDDAGDGPDRLNAYQIDLSEIRQVSTEGSVILALDKQGTVWAWGVNAFGGVGTGTVGDHIKKPTPVIIYEP